MLILAAGLLLLTVPWSQADLPYLTCEDGATFEPVPGNCSYFIACVGAKGYQMPCPSDLIFSLSQERCVFSDAETLEECQQYEVTSEPDDEDATTVMPLVVATEEQDMAMETTTPPSDNDLNSPNPSPTSSPRDTNGDLNWLQQFLRDGNLDMSFLLNLDNWQELLGNRLGFDREQRCRDRVGKIPHDRLCHHYYDCSSPYDDQPLPFTEPYEKECPYPQQFSLETNSCEDYRSVECRGRQEIIDPCDYNTNMCLGPNCRSCRAQFASCQNQPNGLMFWPGRQGTGFWVECQDQRVLAQGDCGEDARGRKMVFDPDSGRCVMYHEMVERMCEWTGNNYDLPHFDACHKYYDCTNAGARPEDSRDDLVRTCQYPQLFSVQSGKCEDFEKVDCGTRKEFFRKCDYEKCSDPDLASCVDLPDGDNECRTKEGSPNYVTCRAQRTVAMKLCPLDQRGLYMQFAPGVGRCLPVDASTPTN